jgi:transposase
MADRVWSEKDLVRRASRRLAVLQHAEEVSGNVAATCRYYGISRNVFYRWKRRYEGEGLDGLKDRSSAPLYCPTVTHPDVVEKIIHLRQHYHFGPMKIRMYLKRYHDVEISASGVWRILKRLGMNRLPASQRYKRHTGGGSATRSSAPAITCKSTSSSSNPSPSDQAAASATTNTPRSTIAPAFAYDGPIPAPTRRPRASSSTTSCHDCPSRSRRSRPTTAPNSSPASTGTCLIRASAISTSGRPLPGSTEKSSVPTASTPKSFTDYSTVSSKTTQACSTRNSGSGRTTTTTTGPTADSAAKPPTKDCYKRLRPSLSPATVSHTPPPAPFLVRLCARARVAALPSGQARRFAARSAGMAQRTAQQEAP